MLISWILLQITQTASNPQSGVAASPEGLSAFTLIMKGGFVMIPIFILSFTALFIFFERLFYISSAGKLDANFLGEIREKLYSGNVKGAMEFCSKSKYPIARLLEKGLNRLGSPVADIERAIENTARVEIYKMEKNLMILGAIAAIAPMFGFLGTVLGMIKAFYSISTQDNISIGAIADSMYGKMVTSAAGLIVGVVAHMLYTYLTNMIDRVTHKMEVTAIDFLDILHKPVQ
jgi:biopolymer transport protein ExbB